ncbi:DHH family phosphoesterase [Weissella oryzae SG25]|uniref:Cyclic-di-AMP phosphodiesterase n=1 Tax=Weissella oryzae (strain DSM 25784 / JCM 18191 / LMG 30913 / SG25) TaxID=1329250 RepID=A0A069CTS9_WEIOS|nr:DHH family phosphoesterase [Weissella oryzae]GAK30894.1 DHH family phosphoesterase [Weissella oryzae SG25]
MEGENSFSAVFHNKQLSGVAIIVSLMAVIGTVVAFLVHWIIGIIWVLLVIVALVVTFRTLRAIGEETTTYIRGLTTRINRAEQEAVVQMPIAVILYNNDNNVVEWVNPFIQGILADEIIINKELSEVNKNLAALVKNWYDEESRVTRLNWLHRVFDVQVQPELGVIYLQDATKSAQIQANYETHRLFLGQVSIDNYDEVTEGMSDADTSSLRSYVTRTLSDWMQERDIYVRRLTSVRYLLIGYRSGLRAAENDKFNILNTIREMTSAQNTPLSLSIGIAYDEANITELAGNAQINLDLALGRGGDQVVVRSEQGRARFYGGNTNPMVKRTRVRARMISQALAELVRQADQVFIIGHARPDMDSFGAALGIRRLAMMMDKPAWVVYKDTGKAHTDIKLLLNQIVNEQGDGVVLTPNEAMLRATDHSLLVMVDHSKPSLSEDRDFYDRLKDRLIIIDHHRRGEEFPESSLLTYIEPYASSTSELVTELFEYQPRRTKGLTRLEASALLAGIQIDTKSFTLRAGTRTFDAASYLRSVGADGDMIQDFLKETVEDYRDRSHLIEQVQIHDRSAIVIGENNVNYDSVVTAQTADALLQLIGVDASYVITRRDNHTVGISARSTGAQNVQLVMEAMGGGGHLSNAATQITDATTDEVYLQLVEAIREIKAKNSNIE